MADLPIYAWALMAQWAALFWAVTLLPDVLKLALRPAQQEWLARQFESVSPETFFSVVRVLFVVGLFIAGFFAWDEQYQVASSKSPEALTEQITSLRNEIEPLRTYKEQHETGEWPALTAKQQQEWVAAFSKYSGRLLEIEIIDFDSRGELLVDSLFKVFKAAHLPTPSLGSDGVGMTEGLRVAAKPKEIGETTRGLLNQLGYKVPPVTDQISSQANILQIFVGRRPLQ